MFYVLSSHNIYALKRQFKTLPKNKTTIIINTLDDTFREQAESYCKEEGLRHFITESDGTAATGKNSFLDQFDKDGVPHGHVGGGPTRLKQGDNLFARAIGVRDVVNEDFTVDAAGVQLRAVEEGRIDRVLHHREGMIGTQGKAHGVVADGVIPHVGVIEQIGGLEVPDEEVKVTATLGVMEVSRVAEVLHEVPV